MLLRLLDSDSVTVSFFNCVANVGPIEEDYIPDAVVTGDCHFYSHLSGPNRTRECGIHVIKASNEDYRAAGIALMSTHSNALT